MMERKNFLTYVIVIALVTLVSCTSTKSTQKPTSPTAETPAQINERANQCRYTTQENYSTLWEKNLNQENLIASLKKRINFLEDRMKQKDGAASPIPPFTVEPLAQTGIYRPYDKCMNQLTVKTPEELKAENAKQETEIISLHKKMTELMQKLQMSR